MKRIGEFIIEYCKSSTRIDNRALLLNAPWGYGKTYYVKNNLKAELKDNEIEMIYVSINGVESLNEMINKILLEMSSESEKLCRSVIGIAKKAISYKTGVNIDDIIPAELKNEFKNTFNKSLFNCKNILFVIDDLERCNLSIEETLGAISDLVENYNAKILIVANEEKLLEECNKDNDNKSNQTQTNTDNAPFKTMSNYNQITYLKIKEKTICDTIEFRPQYKEVIYQILEQSFKNKFDIDKEIISNEIVVNHPKLNLRTLIYSCQKTYEIISKNELDCNLIIHVLNSILAFSCKIEHKPFPAWDTVNNFSLSLGSKTYPLLKSCYDYLITQTIEQEKLSNDYKDYEYFRIWKDNQPNNDLVNKISNWFVSTQKDVTTLMETLQNELKYNNIPIKSYNNLICYLVQIEQAIGYDISKLIDSMCNNVKGHGNEINEDDFFPFSATKTELWNEKYITTLNTLKNCLNDYSTSTFDFNSFDKYEQHVCYNQFLANIDLNKFCYYLLDSHPKTVDTIRRKLDAIYKTIREPSRKEVNCIRTLISKITNDNECKGKDQVTVFQLSLLSKDLLKIIDT